MPRYLEQRMVSHGRVLGHHCHLLVFWQWNPEHHDHRDAGTIDLETAWRRDARDPRRIPAQAAPLTLAAPRRMKPRIISVTLDEGDGVRAAHWAWTAATALGRL